MMIGFIEIFFLFILIFLFVLLIRWPISIAEERCVAPTILGTVKVLSWLGIIFGVTWVIAMIVALLAESQIKSDSLDKLEKLNSLRKAKVITEAEFQKEKKKILK
ncbi:MAG TPA: SHOCT domain-containing protein [Alphaproteobacteria bacterium]|nr:SHOCT domain-containing protein [Alphaproteobacteria bacterium]